MVLDIKMPRLDGIDVMDLLTRGTGKTDIPVVIYSSYSHFKENFSTWAADAYIMKGVGSKEELLQAIEMLF